MKITGNMDECEKRTQNDHQHHQHHFESHGPKRMLHVVLLVFFIFFLICGIESYGVGVSPSVIYARVNDTVEITCFHTNSNVIVDFYEDKDVLVPESFIRRLNSSHIVYVNTYTKPTRTNLTCKSEHKNIIGMSEILIDGELEPVTDFKCRTKDLENMTCAFKQANGNHLKTYRLSYTISNEEKFVCKLKPDMQGGYSCNIKVIEEPLKSVFNFTLRGHTQFFKRKENFDIQLMETLLPKQIQQVEVQLPKPQDTKLSNKAFVVITLPSYNKSNDESIAKEMMFEVTLKSEYDDKWERIIIKDFDYVNKNKVLTLTNIKFANTIYQLRVRMKTKLAEDTDEMWTPYIEKSFKTHPKLPEFIPSVCNNCFNVMESGNIYLHWTEVPKYFQNGDRFSYLLRIFNPKTNELLNETFTSKTSLMIPNRISNKVPHLKIHIYSSNHEGLSTNYASVNVYGNKSKNFVQIKKEWIDVNVGYKLSWKPTDDIKDINNYTIVWCHQVSELPNKCDGSINFMDVSSNETQFYLSTSSSHQFGIAINTKYGRARGIQWAKCTSSKPDEIGTLHSIWATYFNENSILFSWELNCADKDIVSAYKIKYCVIAEYDKTLCLEKESYEKFNISSDNQKNLYQITNLKPYKIYNISISMISTSGRSGSFSKPIMIRTLEGSPSAPQKLKVLDVQSNSIDLQWNIPAEINGPSLTYQLWYNEWMIHIDNNETMNDTFHYRLNDLESFTNYTITVVACTRNCSPSSGSVVQRTRIGKPGRINDIYSVRTKNGSLELKWERPRHFRGYFNYYLLYVSTSGDSEGNYLLYKISRNRNSCIIHEQGCDKNYLDFFMKGVNVEYSKSGYVNINDSDNCFANIADENEEGIIYGDPSIPLPHPCENMAIYILLYDYPLVTLFLIIIIIMFTITIGVKFFKAYKKLQDMKDIKILWPDGLDPYATSKGESICSLANFDLLKTCKNLENIREESFNDLKLYESDSYSKETQEKLSDESSKELLTPLFTKSQTLDAISDGSINKTKSLSVPTSPLKSDPITNSNTGYITMHQPQKSPNKTSVVGYLDMSGKSSNPYINQSHMLNSNDIKSFIQDSQLNNGYIQRNSIKNSVPIKNSNGYVGFASFNRN